MLLNCGLEKTLESPLDRKEIKPVSPKGNQPGIFSGRTNAEAEAPVLWPLNVKNWLTGKDPDAGKDWGQKEKGTTGQEMVGWHHHSMNVSLSKLHATVKANRAWHLQSMELQRGGHNWATEQQSTLQIHVSMYTKRY